MASQWTCANQLATANCDPHSFVLPPVRWGRPDVLFTPAYWVEQVASTYVSGEKVLGTHRLGSTLREECVACLLGGHGIPADVGLAAFDRLLDWGLLNSAEPTQREIFEALNTPLQLSGGRAGRYRFARQKSVYVSTLMRDFVEPSNAMSFRAIRDWLTKFPGVGLKTASWIVRNWYDADDVAILDIHIHRAGLLAGFFDERDRLPRDYMSMERKFLSFAVAIGTRPSLLDAVIWLQMREAGSLVLRSLR